MDMINILKTGLFIANIVIALAMVFVAACFDRKNPDGAAVVTFTLLIVTALVSGLNAGLIHYCM